MKNLALDGAGQRTSANRISAIQATPAAPSIQSSELDHLAELIRRDYPRCQAAFREFNEYRFAIGLRLVKAKEIIGNGLTGNQNAAKKQNCHSGNFVFGNGLTISSKANFGQADGGLVVWMRKEFPDIPQRTLYRYRAWVENEALPALQECWAQLELAIDDPRDLDVLSLPATKREEFGRMLKAATTAKDLTQTLRAMSLAQGDPDSWGPTGGDRTPRDAEGRRIQRTRIEVARDKMEAADSQTRRLILELGRFDAEQLKYVSSQEGERLFQVLEELLKDGRSYFAEGRKRRAF